MTREEWDAAGYINIVPWRLATWKERIFLYGSLALVSVVGVVFALTLPGMIIESFTP